MPVVAAQCEVCKSFKQQLFPLRDENNLLCAYRCGDCLSDADKRKIKVVGERVVSPVGKTGKA